MGRRTDRNKGGRIERKNDRIAKRVYVEECLSCHLVVQPWKKWIDSVNDCLKKNAMPCTENECMKWVIKL